MEENIHSKVAKATVTITGEKGGQGVLVSSNLIITAAHCIKFSLKGEMGLGDYFNEEIETSDGVKFRVATVAVEPVTDLAVLGSLDPQESPKEATNFEEFCERTKPVSLCREDFELFQEFRVHIYNQGKWVTGTAKQCRDEAERLWIETDEEIEAGTSGGPIINDLGELVGIVSSFSLATKLPKKPSGLAPRPHLALPVWLCRRISDSEV